MEGDNSMSERILRILENLINNDTELKEFAIIPTEHNGKNKSPVLYEEHNLGLESWCIKHIYRHVCSDLFEVRKLLAKKKLALHKMESLNRLLIGALLINPEVPTFWNMKRELVEAEVLSFEKEMFFAKLILTSKSKSNEAFAYRKWLIQRILDKIDSQLYVTLLESELGVVDAAADKAQNNYHAWNHRIWCMENIAKRTPFLNRIASELQYSFQWLFGHVSEHTGYHYRQYLFNSVKNSSEKDIFFDYYKNVCEYLQIISDNNPRDLISHLLGKPKNVEKCNNYINFISLLLYDLFYTVDKLNKIFIEHESLFYHRRYLVYNLLKVSHDYHGLEFKTSNTLNTLLLEDNIVNGYLVDERNILEYGEKLPKLFKSQPNKVESSNLYRILLDGEKQFLAENCRINSAVQAQLCKRHEKWLKLVLGLNF